jgi:hypothetical protein
VDIPNALVQTRVENEKDKAFIKIRGILVDILVGNIPRCVQVIYLEGQEGDETVSGAMLEYPV